MGTLMFIIDSVADSGIPASMVNSNGPQATLKHFQTICNELIGKRSGTTKYPSPTNSEVDDIIKLLFGAYGSYYRTLE